MDQALAEVVASGPEHHVKKLTHPPGAHPAPAADTGAVLCSRSAHARRYSAHRHALRPVLTPVAFGATRRQSGCLRWTGRMRSMLSSTLQALWSCSGLSTDYSTLSLRAMIFELDPVPVRTCLLLLKSTTSMPSATLASRY